MLRAGNLAPPCYLPVYVSLTVFLIPYVVSAQVVISEIMYDAPGSDAKAEWVELQNTGTESVDIAKWKINDGSNHVLNAPPKNGSTGSMVIGPGSFLVLASNAAHFTESHAEVSASVIDSTFSFSNTEGTVSLVDAKGAVVDTVSYTSSRGGDGTGESLQKNGNTWVAAKPTPGFTNGSEKLPKVIVAVSTKKTTTKKKSVAVVHDLSEAVLPDVASTTGGKASSDSPMVASVVVPVGSSDGSYVAWAYGALALGVAGAAAVVVTRQKKKGEWEIEEIA